MNLQPLEKFAEENGNPTWHGKEEYLIYHSENERFRLVVEHASHESINHSFAGLWRTEQLAEQGISASCEDAKEMAKKLLDTLFYHMSPHQTQHVVNALQAYLEEDHQERTAHYAANPQFFGTTPPSRISDECKD